MGVIDMLVRSKKTLASGLKKKLVELKRPPVPVQSTATGEWTVSGDPTRLVKNYAQVQLTRGADDYGSHEYEADNTLTVQMYNYTSSEDLKLSDFVVLDGKNLRIVNVEYLDNGEMIIKCMQS